jgi:hypothetical protein
MGLGTIYLQALLKAMGCASASEAFKCACKETLILCLKLHIDHFRVSFIFVSC